LKSFHEDNQCSFSLDWVGITPVHKHEVLKVRRKNGVEQIYVKGDYGSMSWLHISHFQRRA
jgi:hypothetical protein